MATIRVNLLPYREQARQVRKQQFFIFCGVAALLSVLIAFAVFSFFDGQIEAQEAENRFLKSEIVNLDKEIEQIKRLKTQVESLKSRKQVIESLQVDRNETVYLLSELVSIMPEGVFLKSMKQEGNRITLNGVAQSNARVSSLMSNIDMSQWMTGAQLVETHAAVQDKRRVQEFTVTLLLTRNKISATGGGAQ